MKGAKILPGPLPCAISNSLDNAPEYNTRALISVYKSLTLCLPNLLVPTPFTKGGGGGGIGGSARSPVISKNRCSHEFYRVLETAFKVLELLKLFT